MNLIIDHHKKISEIQTGFQKHFPFLKIEFYSKTHELGKGSPKTHLLRSDLTIAEAQDFIKDGVIRISPDMRVADVEHVFDEVFGLHVQIFRLSGKLWIQTTSTDHLTLADQNKMGLEMERPIIYEGPGDYHEQE